MARSKSNSYDARIFSLLCGAIFVAVLSIGREILLPLAVAILLSFLLAPLVDRLEHWRVPRIPAVLTVVVVCVAGLGLLGVVLGQQLYDIAYQLPTYKQNIIDKAHALQSGDGGVVERVSQTVKDVRKELEQEKNDPAAPQEAAAPAEGEPLTEAADGSNPVLVKVVEELSVEDIAARILGPLLPPLAKAAMVIVFVIFMLLEREDLRNRFISLIGPHQLNVTTKAIDDASGRVSRYLRMQLIINVSYGVVIALGLYFIGLPNALLWGAMTAILRFIPYIGPWIAAAMPIVLSLAVFDGWTQPLLVVGLFVVNELISNNLLEPWLYGASTGLSTIGVLVSALFWTWIWGPVGLVMATPLTVCLTVLGRYIPEMSFIATLLSDEETLPPPSQFYQRMLAMDPEEAFEIAEDYADEHSLLEAYDDVILPALRLAEQDRHRGSVDDEKAAQMYQSLRELIDELAERVEQAELEQPNSEEAAPENGERENRSDMLCLPARDEADEIVGLMLAHVVRARGVDLRVLTPQVLTSEVIERIADKSYHTVCISALPPQASTHARYQVKRLRPRFPEIRIVVGLWEGGGPIRRSKERLSQLGVDQIATTLKEAADTLASFCTQDLAIQSETPEGEPSEVT